MSTKSTLTAAAASRARLADAEVNLATVQAELEQARDNAVSIEARLRRGDMSLSSTEVLTARIDVERYEAAVEAADAEVTRAQRGLRIDLEDAKLAAAVSEHVSAILDVPAGAAVERATTATGAMPYVQVVQRKAGGYDASTGEHSGSVELLYVRTDKHRELDAEPLVEALKKSGVGMDHSRSHMQLRTHEEHLDGAVADVLKLDIVAVTPRDSLPVITAEVRSAMMAALRSIGSTLSREVRQRGTAIDPSRFGYVPPVVLGDGHANVNYSGTIHYGNAGGQLASERPEPFARVDDVTTRDGIRTVTGTFGTYLSAELYVASELGKVATMVIDHTIVGHCYGAIGRVESAEFVTSQQASGKAIFAEFKVMAKSATA